MLDTAHDLLMARLAKRLGEETGEHPRMREAVQSASDTVAAIEWNADHQPIKGADRFANEVEDWLGFHGEFLEDWIVPHWHAICRRSLIYAKTECSRRSCPRL